MSDENLRERMIRLETKFEHLEKDVENMVDRVFPTFVKLSRYLPVEKIVMGLAGTALVFIVKFILEETVIK